MRFRRGSSNNLVENCTFTNSGTYAYCSEWEAGPAEPEVCSNVIFRGNELFSGYAGAPIPAIMIFNPGTDQAAPADSARLNEYDNTIYPSTLNTTVPAAVKNYSAVVDGSSLADFVPVYSIDRCEPYLNVDDLAFLLKGTRFEFTCSANESGKTVTLTTGNSCSVSGFSVQTDAAEGEITAERLLEWSVSCDEQKNGTLPVFRRNGSYFVSLTAVREMMDFQLTVDSGAASLSIVTVSQTVTVPETIQVLKLKFPGSFENKGENNGNYALTDSSNFDVITMKTADLSGIIRFEALIRDKVKYAIVAIPIGNGAYGIREWKNAAIKDYYTLEDRKWSSASGGYADSFHTTHDEFIYYAIIPVGGEKPSQYPQFRVAKGWTSGSISNYSQFFITDIENYATLAPVSFDPLTDSYQTAQGLSAAKYTPESWSLLQKSMLRADTLLSNARASQTEIDEAAAALKAAINTLVPRGNKAELNRALAQARQLAAAEYTDESATRLAEAISSAEQVAANENAGQSAIDEALATLSSAVQALQPAQASSVGSSSLPAESGTEPGDNPITGGASGLLFFAFVGAASALIFLFCRQRLCRNQAEPTQE